MSDEHAGDFFGMVTEVRSGYPMKSVRILDH